MKKLLIFLVIQASFCIVGSELQFSLEEEINPQQEGNAAQKALVRQFMDLAWNKETSAQEMEAFLAEHPQLNINVPSTEIFKGYTALHFACTSGNLPVCELLINRGAALKTAPIKAPLILAAENGHADICKLIIEFDETVLEEQARDALFIAAQKGHLPICTLFIVYIANTLENYKDLMYKAAENGQNNVITLLRELNVKLPLEPEFLFAAATGGLATICQELIEKGIPANCLIGGKVKMTPLYIARDRLQLAQSGKDEEAVQRYQEVIALLEEHGGESKLIFDENSGVVKMEKDLAKFKKALTVLGYALRAQGAYNKFMDAFCCCCRPKKKLE